MTTVKGSAVLTYKFDRAFGIVVWLFSGQTNEDADYELYVKSIAELSVRVPDVSSPAAIIVIDPGNPIPNALWRKRIAEVSSGVPREALVVFVGSSPLVRGTVLAVNWVKPLPFDFHVVATFAEATALIGRKRGYPLKLLDELYGEARKEAASRRGAD